MERPRQRSLQTLALMIALVAPASRAAERVSGGTVALVNVRVVSMNPEDRKTVRKRRTVIVEDGRITEIGKTKKVNVPEDAEVINGRNKLYVLPGLADMHVHTDIVPRLPETVTPGEVYTYFFANGVTTMLDMAGFKEAFKWRRDINRGKLVGPTFNFTTPSIDEEDYRSLEEVEADLRKWADQGYAYIKCHNTQTPAFFEHVHALGRELNVPVVNHALRPGYPIQDTLAQEPLMIAHIEEILSTSVSGSTDFEGQLETPLQDVANSRVWVTGTVNLYEIIANTRDDGTFAELLARPEMRFLPPSVREVWEFENRYRQPGFGGSREFWLDQLDIELYIARRLKELGALDRLLLGTDVGVDLVLPGFSIHDELRLMVQAGLTPWEAILTGTYNPAVFFETIDEAGTVEEGKRADLMVAKKNPLKRIERLRDLVGVMVNGVWLSEEVLANQLEELAERWSE
jgi:cytosine/adenosine deaminase-related metal-dependent hydrolase